MPPVSSSGPSSASVRTTIVVIPARYHSTRLPGKALADIAGRPMIEHVYRRASEARSVAAVIVATDDERIAAAVRAFGGEVRMTSVSHRSGTDRLAEVVASLECDLVVNVQGDEPLIEPAMIDEAVAPFAAEPGLRMSTLRRRLDDPADFRNPNVTKVVVDRDGYALYFSRAPIPYRREDSPAAPAWRHVGLYVYRRECLLLLSSLAPTALEQSEALEQLRALEHGIKIKAIETEYDSVGVDTPDDLERVRKLVADAVTDIVLSPTSATQRELGRDGLPLNATPGSYRQRLRPERGAQSPRATHKELGRAGLPLNATPGSYPQRLRPERGAQSPRESEWGWGPTSINRGARRPTWATSS